MTTKERILQLATITKSNATDEQKHKAQDKAKVLFDTMYQDKAQIKKGYDWLQEHYPDHLQAEAGLARYEQLCDQFLEKHGIYEHELEGIGVEWISFDNPLKKIAPTWKIIDQNGQETVTADQLHLMLDRGDS